MPLSSIDSRSESERAIALKQLESKVKTLFFTHPELSTTGIANELGGVDKVNPKDLYSVLNSLEKLGLIKRPSISGGSWFSLMTRPKTDQKIDPKDPRIPKNVLFLDWANVLPALLKCYELKLHPLLIGPHGTGKTAAVSRLAELVSQPLESLNFSLRAREHHLIGRLDPQPDGTIAFLKGPLTRSMEEGTIFYADEPNTAEPDVLLRFDEAFDHRKEIHFENQVVKANPNWFCVASINPLSHAGTKELPPQILSRFPVRVHFTYPDIENELQIIRMHVPFIKGELFNIMRNIVTAVHHIRQQTLAYIPSVRETIAIAKLLCAGVEPGEAITLCIINVYQQFDDAAAHKVRELLISRGVLQ